jgi:hypothetical protein
MGRPASCCAPPSDSRMLLWPCRDIPLFFKCMGAGTLRCAPAILLSDTGQALSHQVTLLPGPFLRQVLFFPPPILNNSHLHGCAAGLATCVLLQHYCPGKLLLPHFIRNCDQISCWQRAST